MRQKMTEEERKAKARKASRSYRDRNKDKQAAYAREYNQRPEVKAANARRTREYYQRDPVRTYGLRRQRAAEKPEMYEYTKRKNQLKQYGITPEEYDALLEKQGGRCAGCGTDTPKLKERYYKYFSVDHCHGTTAVRGLLCQNCNMGLGLLKDNPATLLALAAYLAKAKEAAGGPDPLPEPAAEHAPAGA